MTKKQLTLRTKKQKIRKHLLTISKDLVYEIAILTIAHLIYKQFTT